MHVELRWVVEVREVYDWGSWNSSATPTKRWDKKPPVLQYKDSNGFWQDVPVVEQVVNKP